MQKIGTAGPVHVGGRVDRDAAVADLAQGLGLVGVAAHQRGHVEGDREPAAAGGEDHLVALVGLPGVAEPGELPDGPGAPAVAGGVEAARVRELPRPADALEPRVVRRRPVHRLDLGAGERREVGVPPARSVETLLPAAPALLDVLHVHERAPPVSPPTDTRTS
jgi:hypothetical protein